MTIEKVQPATRVVNEKSKAKFAGICRVCGTVLTFIPGTNVMACKNPACQGYKLVKKEDEEEDEIVPSYRLLDDLGVEIATSLFCEKV